MTVDDLRVTLSRWPGNAQVFVLVDDDTVLPLSHVGRGVTTPDLGTWPLLVADDSPPPPGIVADADILDREAFDRLRRGITPDPGAHP